MTPKTAVIRPVKKIWKSEPTIEGAGVHLKRAFGFRELPQFDPFLLLDDFRSDTPADFLAGFPWHPHRGIETITYVLDGDVEHEDSLGNGGVIGAGDVQWMTAGGGILHQEMPKGNKKGKMYGFQLWANLPAKQKMMDPRYRDVKAKTIPIVKKDGAEIRVIAGQVGETIGPVRDVVTGPEYLDISLPPKSSFEHPVAAGHTVFAYVVDGECKFDTACPSDTLALFGPGDTVKATTGKTAARFLLCSGKPIKEPIAWYGPIVMNTKAELKQAFEDYQKGTFARPLA